MYNNLFSECCILRVMRDSRYIPGSDLGHCFRLQQFRPRLDNATSDEAGAHVDSRGRHIDAGCNSSYAGSYLGIFRLVSVLHPAQTHYGRLRSRGFGDVQKACRTGCSPAGLDPP